MLISLKKKKCNRKKYPTYFVTYTNSEMKKYNKMQSWKVQRANGTKDSNFYLESFCGGTLSQMHFHNHGIPPGHKTTGHSIGPCRSEHYTYLTYVQYAKLWVQVISDGDSIRNIPQRSFLRFLSFFFFSLWRLEVLKWIHFYHVKWKKK